MKSLKNLSLDEDGTLILENLSCLECLYSMEQAKRMEWRIESMGCWGCEAKVFKFHTYEDFCLNRLIDVDDWNFHAYAEILDSYREEVLAKNPKCFPVFDLEITRDFDPELRRITESAVETLQKLKG